MTLLTTFLDLGVGIFGAGVTFISDPKNLVIAAPIGMSLLAGAVGWVRSLTR